MKDDRYRGNREERRPGEYHHATALEALVGWLYVTGQRERMNDILQMALPEEIFGQQAKR